MKKLTLLSLLFLTLFACRQDVEDTLSSETSQNDPTITIIDYNPEIIDVTATLFGTVYDELNNTVAGATVRLGSNNQITDDDGRFVIKNVTMNQAGTFVEVIKDGYFPGSHRFFPEDGSTNFATITLLEKTNTGSFISSDGGSVTGEGGIKMDFPANSVVKANGETYNGTVEVSARWLNPAASNIEAIMPGGLQAVNTQGEEVALASFSMMAVELESDAGESLNLGNDLKATLTFPVPAELLGNAPAEIPLWYFSEDYGIWIQEGTATLQGNTYVGDVAHFSFWNCDAPFPLIKLTGQLVSANGNPLQYMSVELTVLSSGITRAGWVNSQGVFSGKVPKDEEFEMNVSHTLNSCIAFTQNIGPFSVDTDLGTITVNDPAVVDVTGNVTNCAGAALTNGWIDVTVGDSTNYSYYITDGNVNMAFFNCENETEITVVGVNLTDLEMSDPVTYTISNPMDLGTISACGTPLTEYLIFTVDGLTTTFLNPWHSIGNDSISVAGEGGQGNQVGYVDVRFEGITALGTYPGSVVYNATFSVEGSTESLYLSCFDAAGNPNDCDFFDEVVITEYAANPGEFMVGTFSGTGSFNTQDSTSGPLVLPFTGAFSVERD